METILGLVLGSVGTLLAVVTYSSPLWRFKWYLKNHDLWEKEFDANKSEFFRHKRHPEFQIVQDNEAASDNYNEPWIGNMPDMEHNKLYRVEARVHGTYLMSEMFAYLDGGRYFVPMPHVESAGRPPHKTDGKDTRRFYYDELQVRLARVIGDVYRDESIEDFAKAHDIEIRWPTRSQKVRERLRRMLPEKTSRRRKG